MEPRWMQHWAVDRGNTFLGGVPEADLWIDYDGDLRIVWERDWGHVMKGSPSFKFLYGYQDSDRDKIIAAMPAIKQYLQLFCPDAWAELQIKPEKVTREVAI